MGFFPIMHQWSGICRNLPESSRICPETGRVISNSEHTVHGLQIFAQDYSVLLEKHIFFSILFSFISIWIHFEVYERGKKIKVNKQDFQGSGIEKIEDNLASADPLSYTTTILIPGRPGKLSECLFTCKYPLHSSLWSP